MQQMGPSWRSYRDGKLRPRFCFFETSLGWIEVSFQKVFGVRKVKQFLNSFDIQYPEAMERSVDLVTFVSFSPSQIAPQPTPPQNFHLVCFFSSGKRSWLEDLNVSKSERKRMDLRISGSFWMTFSIT